MLKFLKKLWTRENHNVLILFAQICQLIKLLKKVQMMKIVLHPIRLLQEAAEDKLVRNRKKSLVDGKQQ